jgi:hypothetical protein
MAGRRKAPKRRLTKAEKESTSESESRLETSEPPEESFADEFMRKLTDPEFDTMETVIRAAEEPDEYGDKWCLKHIFGIDPNDESGS